MSAPPFVADASEAQDQAVLYSKDAYSTIGASGQNHDRIRNDDTKMARTPSDPDAPVEVSALQRMGSATLGSFVTSILATPLDVVRVRLQSQSPNASSSSSTTARFAPHGSSFQKLPSNLGVTACCREVFWVGDNAQYCLAGPSQTAGGSALHGAECAVEETQKKTFTSTLDGLRKIARNEGPLTLWRGLSPTLLMAIPANVIYFTGYDWLRFSPKSPIRRVASDTYSPLIAGSVARVAAAMVVSPIEMFRTRMQAHNGQGSGLFRSTLQDLLKMTQTQGYTSLWRGLTLTMWRDVPFSGLYWWGYEAVRNGITDIRSKVDIEADTTKPLFTAAPTQSSSSRREAQTHEKHMTTFVDSFVSGSISGAFAAFVTTPFDVGKTRQQVYRHDEAPSAMKNAAKTTAPEQFSMPRFLLHILKQEGASGLFKGWAARCLKVAPSCGIMISSYEIGKKYAKTMNEHKEQQQQQGKQDPI